MNNSTRSDHDDDDKPIDLKMYPGEYGNVEGWFDRSKLELSLQRQRHNFNPAAVFEEREPMYLNIETIETPVGRAEADPDIGEAWIVRPDGSPAIKKTLNFTPSVDLSPADTHEPPLAVIQIVTRITSTTELGMKCASSLRFL